MAGWIKLHRVLSEWEWYDDHNAVRLLVHLLIHVNYEDKRWKGTVIKAGSMALSWETLSVSVGLSVKQCRSAMVKLEESGEVTRETTTRYQVVSLVKWSELQGENQEKTSKKTSGGQKKGSGKTPTKQYSKETLELRKREFKEGIQGFQANYSKADELEELNKFYLHWTQMNKNGFKMAFEKQRTWDLAGRLRTWFGNKEKWNKTNKTGNNEPRINRQTEHTVKSNLQGWGKASD